MHFVKLDNFKTSVFGIWTFLEMFVVTFWKLRQTQNVIGSADQAVNVKLTLGENKPNCQKLCTNRGQKDKNKMAREARRYHLKCPLFLAINFRKFLKNPKVKAKSGTVINLELRQFMLSWRGPLVESLP